VWLASRRVVLPTGVHSAAIAIEDGRIADIVPQAPPGVGALDLGELVISPGIVDCHVHINEPGRTEWEGFETATRAAAAGGVTTLIDMPLNSIPVTTHAAALEEKLAASERKRYVDLGFWGGVVPGNAPLLSGLAEHGVLGCKCFLVHSGIDDFPNATEHDLRQAMPVLRDHGLPLLAHAELDLSGRAGASGYGASAAVGAASPRSYHGYLASRPPEWEDAAIRLLIKLCRETRCHVHVVHLSSAGSLATISAAKAEGLPLTVETCPHYLCLEAEQIPDGATEYKCAPPIREHDNREALWQGLLDGVIDFVITDHSPCTPELKLPGEGDFQRAWGGIASLSLGLAAVWTEARKRGATLVQLARWMSSAPARFAGVAGKKGSIARGHDADFVVWDPDAPFAVEAQQLFFKHKVSPYLGKTLYGRVHHTFLRGREIYDGAQHTAGAVGGVLLHRTSEP
jgi:allantoinase